MSTSRCHWCGAEVHADWLWCVACQTVTPLWGQRNEDEPSIDGSTPYTPRQVRSGNLSGGFVDDDEASNDGSTP